LIIYFGSIDLAGGSSKLALNRDITESGGVKVNRVFTLFLSVFMFCTINTSYADNPTPSEMNLKQFPTDRNPFSIVTTNGQEFWLTNWYKNTVMRFESSSNNFTDEISVGTHPTSLALYGNTLWVGNFEDASISVIDTSARKVVDTLMLPTSAMQIVSGGGYVWALLAPFNFAQSSNARTRILKFDGQSRHLLGTWTIRPCSSLPCDTTRQIDGEPLGIAANGTSLWFCYQDAGKSMPVTKVNASTDIATSGLTVPDGCNGLWGSDNFLAVSKSQNIYLRDARDLSDLGTFSVDAKDGVIQNLWITEKTLYVTVFNFFDPKASTFIYQFDIKGKNLEEKIEFKNTYIHNFLVFNDQLWSVGYTRTSDGSIDKSNLWTFSSFDFREKTKAAAAAEVTAKQDLADKAAADKAAADKAAADKAAADKAAADALAAQQMAHAKAVALKKSSITCVSGRLIKTVSGLKPTCPTGYRKK